MQAPQVSCCKGRLRVSDQPTACQGCSPTQRIPRELVGVGVGLQVSGEPIDCNIEDREQEMGLNAHDTTREE